jgi:hypothetical protein
VISGERPKIPDGLQLDAAQRVYIKLMERCWANDPFMRPSMGEVYEELDRISSMLT